ncbi:TetR/AcrR family transcriptional regulator [Streptomyces litchfieldiae]|uniref:TetR family transcriptional regulator n=1 Tax=Streptomyces litchfieldiae TaxID=3075543 RepID=A0ABU2MMW9_9ACTN|nr:TetR family transcriptional regulator [Streptomyces sp. DSM 44938]MDT0342796.1 TetR family transcriptional regulator [Streptomyces sp. DSM 44938]
MSSENVEVDEVAWAPRRRFGPRSAPARRAILEAARARFAEDGYERATIRAIAADAGVDPAMVMRYYGSKAELFTATVRVASDLEDLSTVPRDEVGRRFAGAMLGRWERGENKPEEAVLRAAPTHPEAARSMQVTFEEQILPALRNAFPDDPDIDTRAGLILTQGLGTVLCRYVLKIEPVASMDFEQLLDAVGATMQHHLTAPLKDAAAQGR